MEARPALRPLQSDPVPRAEKQVRRMVLSNQPDQPLQDAKYARSTPQSLQASREFQPLPEHGDRGHVERVTRMQSGRIGRLNNTLQPGNFSMRHTPTHRTSWMRATLTLSLFFTLAGAVHSVHAQSAGTWNKRGQDAEAREDYDAAYSAYRQAHLKKPADLRYKERYERLRFQASAMHVDRGRVLRQSGDYGGAITEFTRALEIDPGDQAATQELQVTQQPAAQPPAGAAPGAGGSAAAAAASIPGAIEEMPGQAAMQREIASMAAPVDLQPVSNDPITLNMVEDTKVIYQAIGKAAGLNVIFDPDYQSKRIPVDLTSVSLWDALRIVGTISGTFWKPVTQNTLYVAANTRQKRTDVDDLALQTFYLTNISQPNDANEIQIALRNMLDPSIKIYLVPSQNALVLRATPDELALAGKLIRDLDRPRSEVVVDIAVLEVSRDKVRNLGITLPTSFGLTPQQSNANSNSTTSSTSSTSSNTTTTGTSSTGTTSTNITLNTLGNINATNFAVSLTGGQVNALLSDSDTRILQNPRLRATDGQHATLKIGSKIPVATGSYSAGAAISAGALGVQTQFQYLDVGVNIDVTPTVHYDREVTLKMKIEVSTHSGDQTISGVTEPIISQRVPEETITVKDGEPSVIAGILTKSDAKSVSGTPGLGEIPLLKYFFSSQNREQQTDEIVFLIVPHIVRSSMLTAENTRAVATGTTNSIEVRRDPSLINSPVPVAGSVINQPAVSEVTASRAANAAIGTMAAGARPPLPPSSTTPTPAGLVPATAPAAAGIAPAAAPNTNGGAPIPINLSLVPSAATQAVGSTFQIALTVANAHDLFNVPVQLHFDPKVLALVNVDAGEMLVRDNQSPLLVHRDEGNGTVTISAGRPPNAKGVDGQGTICTLTFKALSGGDSTISMLKIGAKDSRQNSLPAIGTQATVHVK